MFHGKNSSVVIYEMKSRTLKNNKEGLRRHENCAYAYAWKM